MREDIRPWPIRHEVTKAKLLELLSDERILLTDVLRPNAVENLLILRYVPTREVDSGTFDIPDVYDVPDDPSMCQAVVGYIDLLYCEPQVEIYPKRGEEE